MRFPFKKLEIPALEMLDLDVKLGELIGDGVYGSVFKALNKVNGKFIAVKHLKLRFFNNQADLNKLKNNLAKEINLLRELEHPHIVKYLGCKEEGENVYIYMEHMPGGSLSSMLKQYGRFEENVIKKFTKQLLEGLAYLHSKKVIHSDLKGCNILSDGRGNVKLSDFGATRHLEGLPIMSESKESLSKVTERGVFWTAPEVLLMERKCGTEVDIWSLGCTIIEMASGRHPWASCTSMKNFYELIEKKTPPQIPGQLSEKCRDFIMQCCNYNRKNRPHAQDLLKHPFIVDDSI